MERSSWESNISSNSPNSPHFMESEGSLPHSQGSATCPSPESHQSNPIHVPPTHFLKDHLNLFTLQSLPRCSRWSVSLRFPDQNPVCASPPHVLRTTPISFLIWSPEQFVMKPRSSSLCSLLHYLVTSSHLDARKMCLVFDRIVHGNFK